MSKRTKLMIKNILLVILGTSLLAFGTGIFIIPFELVTGGISSAAIILNHFWEFEGSLDLYVGILTWGLFFLGLFVLGKEFAAKTLISTIVYPIVFSLSYRLVECNVFNGFFNLLSYSHYQGVSIILAAVFGGAFVGAGCAITFLGGGSTGGFDVFAFTICKYFKRAKSSLVIFLTDVILIAFGALVIQDLVVSLLGISSAFICAIVIDKLFLGESKAFIAQIVSDKYEEINRAVINQLDRTTTIIEAMGGYSREEKKVLMVSFTMSQYSLLVGLVSSVDKNAFMTIHRAHEINGEGWTK